MAFNDGHHCELPDAAPGDTWICPTCHWKWLADDDGPLDIRWLVAS